MTCPMICRLPFNHLDESEQEKEVDDCAALSDIKTSITPIQVTVEGF